MLPSALGVLTLVAALVLTWLPGLLVLRAGGVRGLLAAAAAPAATLGLVATAALVLPAGWRWSLLMLALMTVVVAALLLGVRMLARRLRPASQQEEDAAPARVLRPGWTMWVVVAAGVLAALAASLVYLHVSRGLTVVPQDYDHVFQANAIRYIAETGDPTPAGLQGVNDYASGSLFYYPAAWHALAALLVPLAQGDVLLVEHSMVLTWFVALPLAAGALARSFRLRWPGVTVAVLCSTAFTALPWEMLWRGLLPFAASLVFLVPVVLLAAYGARHRNVATAVLLALAVFGLVSVHTSAAMSFLVFGIPALVAVLWAERGQRLRILLWVGGAAALVVVALVPMVLAVSKVLAGTTVTWPSVLQVRDAILFAVTGTGVYREVSWWNLGWFLVPGMVLALRPRFSWAWAFVVSTVIGMGLFVLTAAVDLPFADALTQYWWNDPLRTAALATLAAPALVGVLFQSIADRWPDDVSLPATVRGAGRLSLVGFVGALALLGATCLATLLDAHRYVAEKYSDGPTVTEGEREAYDFIAAQDPQGRVMNDPGDGSAWMYALDDIKPVFAHFGVPGDAPDVAELFNKFDELGTDTAVRQIVEKYDIQYVVVGEGMVFPTINRAPGLVDLAAHPDVFREVYTNDDATVYEVVGG